MSSAQIQNGQCPDVGTLAMRPNLLDKEQPYWVGHLPFAFWIIETMKPRLLVELGVHTGNSYFAFCQAVRRFDTNTRCYAVDTWKGDIHIVDYRDDCYERVVEANREYSAFSMLLKKTFEEALSDIADGSVDLLHIDGEHTYSAVKQDFEGWLPKLSDRAVVLFHDVCVRRPDFGVWKLWDEIKYVYPSYLFEHSHGLGVLLVGKNAEPNILEFAAQRVDSARLTAWCLKTAGESLLDELTIDELESEKAELEGQKSVLQSQMAELEEQKVALEGEKVLLDSQNTSLKGEVYGVTNTTAQLHIDLASEKERHEAQRKTLSWRVTAPLRVVAPALAVNFFRIKSKLCAYYDHIQRLLPISQSGPVEPLADQHNCPEANVSEPGVGISQYYFDLPAAGSEFVPLMVSAAPRELQIRLIAFYLPQFHPIPENDEWWGDGFTEWTNVRPAEPQFAGHYQPHIPGELGYYDLRDNRVQRRQIELAKLYGIGGFCFYFYWFGGKRLLEEPVLRFLEDTTLDFPFCLCWANESWSRRWDGRESDVLIEQEHSEQDEIDFIEYIVKYINDHRYIRIDGRPLLIIYRPDLLLSPNGMAKRWREWFRQYGIGEIYLAYTQSFEDTNPILYDFDAAIEYPPNNYSPEDITSQQKELSADFSGNVCDWNSIARQPYAKSGTEYPLFRGVNPGWDNTARRKNKGRILVGNSPKRYQHWLMKAARDTVSRFSGRDERLVFVNAWNEWAEGAYLEPDQRFGYAYLQATRNALEAASSSDSTRKILLVLHDAHAMGAEYLGLHLAKCLSEDFGLHLVKCLSEDFGFEIELVCLGYGSLLPDYSRYANVHSFPSTHAETKLSELLAELHAAGFRSAIVNSLASGLLTKQMRDEGFCIVSLVHELPNVIESMGLEGHLRCVVANSDCVVFPASQVKESVELLDDIPEAKAIIRPQGLYKVSQYRTRKQKQCARDALRAMYSLPSSAQIVINVGHGDYRKGVDLFVDAGIEVIRLYPGAYFVWVGNITADMWEITTEKLRNVERSDHFIFAGHNFDTDIYYAGADVFALSSREHSFPSVVMEAMAAALPVTAFRDSGVFCELLSRGGGLLVDSCDAKSLAAAVAKLLNDPACALRLGQEGARIVAEEFSFRQYVQDLTAFANTQLKRISVIVINYNYGQYLPARLASIVNQNYPIYELILIDNGSTDDSLRVMNGIARSTDIPVKLIINDDNSDFACAHWQQGVERAAGDYVWIAEPDDLAEPDFLAKVLRGLADPGVVMSFSQSKQINGQAQVMCENYLEFVADIDPDKWRHAYLYDGVDEIRQSLAIKNTIPSVSAVVFARNVLERALADHFDEISQYRAVGDWLTYIRILMHGAIAYTPESLNLHRSYSEEPAIGNPSAPPLADIIRLQRLIQLEYKIDPSVERRGAAYVHQLKEQFSASGDGV